jgi:ankyrin repeat protein
MEVKNESELKVHDKEKAVTYFRHALRTQNAMLEKVMIDNGYDKLRVIVDYICEGKLQKILSDQSFKATFGVTNSKGQTLIHVLARNVSKIQEFGQATKFMQHLVDNGVDPEAKDNKGRSVFHHAVKSGSLPFIKFLVEGKKHDINSTDAEGANALNILLKGDRLLTCNQKILEYLI